MHLRGACNSCAWVCQVVASAGQSTEGSLLAVGRWNSTGFLFDSAKVETAITATTSVSTTVSLQVAEGVQIGTSTDQLGRLGWSIDSTAKATVLEAVKGIRAAAAARGTIDQWWMTCRSDWVHNTVAGMLDADALGKSGRQRQYADDE